MTANSQSVQTRTNDHETYLRQLEAESIFIMREAAAECSAPVLLYSIGKDSSVLLHLALKAFAPSRPPFPLLHIDTTWKFREMIAFRDEIAERHGLDLIVHTNQNGVARGVNPISMESGPYTDIMKTQALRHALDSHGFTGAIGGARRDEEKSRAKERVFSFRTEHHRWDPKAQRPELWSLYNARVRKGESVRIFPLSNWTELDIWRYIELEDIPLVPLYFAAPRRTIIRDGQILALDDERMPFTDDDQPMERTVRFRTLGCYPLTAAVPSTATTVSEIVAELEAANSSERFGRLIDHDEAASMERKKQEGYF